jgi:hypothetical protein
VLDAARESLWIKVCTQGDHALADVLGVIADPLEVVA